MKGDMDEDKLDSDLSSVMQEFRNFRKQYNIEHKWLQELRNVVRDQKKSLQLARESQRVEQQNSEQAWLIVEQQNQSIVDHIRTKEENVQLTEVNAALKKDMENIITKMQKEKESSDLAYKTLETVKSKEIFGLQLNCEERIALAREAMEDYRNEFEMKKQLMFESFDQMKSKEQEQSNLEMLVHEEQLQKLSEQLSVTTADHDIKMRENENTISALKRHIGDLERKLRDSEKHRQVMTPAAATNTPSVSYLWSANQRPATVVKKTPAYTAGKQSVGTPSSEFSSVGWSNQKVGVSAPNNIAAARKHGIQSLPFVSDATNRETGGQKRLVFGGRSATTDVGPPKKRKLFTPHDDFSDENTQ